MLELTRALKAKCESLGLRYVPGSGLPTSKMWMIGEAPGKEENDALQVFVGPSGGLLNGCCRNAGVDRGSCFVSNVAPIRPPDNKLFRLGELGIQPSECFEALKEQIRFFKPNVILALGAPAFRALAGHESIREWRGYILVFEGTKVIGSFHPAFMLHMGDKSAKKEREDKGGVKYTYGTAKMCLILDLMRAKEEAEYPEKRLLKMNLLWDQPQEVDLLRLNELMVAPELAFDIETKGVWVDRISFSGLDYSVSIALDRGILKSEIRKMVGQILINHKGLVAQNGMFDMAMLKKAGMPVGCLYADPMVAHHLIYPEWPHGLDFLASIYTKLDYPPHGPGWDSDENIGHSNALHSFLTINIWQQLKQELREIEDEIKNSYIGVASSGSNHELRNAVAEM